MKKLIFENPLVLTLPVPVFVGGAFVGVLLALRKAYLDLGAAFVPVQIKRYQRVSLALDVPGQAIQLIPVQQ